MPMRCAPMYDGIVRGHHFRPPYSHSTRNDVVGTPHEFCMRNTSNLYGPYLRCTTMYEMHTHMRCTPMYEMHGYAYMWNCPRCTPVYKITLDVRLCVRCTPPRVKYTPPEVKYTPPRYTSPRYTPARYTVARCASPTKSVGVCVMRFLISDFHNLGFWAEVPLLPPYAFSSGSVKMYADGSNLGEARV
jgi:hypothetical protein